MRDIHKMSRSVMMCIYMCVFVYGLDVVCVGMTLCVKDWTLQGMRKASIVGFVVRVCERNAVQTRMTILRGLGGLTC